MLQDRMTNEPKNKTHGHKALGIRQQSNIKYKLEPQRSHKARSKMHRDMKHKTIKQYLILALISFHGYVLCNLYIPDPVQTTLLSIP